MGMGADSSVISSPLVIHEELKEYSDLIQNVGAIGMSPAPAPAPALAPESEPPVPAEQVIKKGAAASRSVAVARQTSIQMRKGPLIFNTAAESSEAGPAQAQAPARPTLRPVVTQKQTVPGISQKPNFVPPSGGLGAYPSPPTDFSPLMDESITRQPTQKRSHAEPENNLTSARATPQAMKLEQQIVNFSVPRPAGTQPQQQFPSYRPQAQNQAPLQPIQMPRRQASLAQSNSQPRPRTPQTLLRTHHDDPNIIPLLNGQGLLSSDAQPKPHRVVTKIRQASPATPPTSPKKSARRLDSTGELNDRGRPYSVAASARSERPEIPKAPVMNASDRNTPTPERESSHTDMSRQADFDPVAMKRKAQASVDVDTDTTNSPPPFKAPPTPVSPEERSRDNSRPSSSVELQPSPPPPVGDTTSQLPESAEPREPSIIRAKPRPMTGFSMTEFSLTGFLSDAGLLYNILGYLSFYDWVSLFSLSKQIRTQLEEDRDLREEVLERYLETIGYERWGWDEEEALSLTLRVG